MRYRRASSVQHEDAGGVTVAVVESGRWLTLRGAAKFIWEQLDEERAIEDIQQKCVASFRGDEQSIRKDVTNTLDNWARVGLVEAKDD